MQGACRLVEGLLKGQRRPQVEAPSAWGAAFYLAWGSHREPLRALLTWLVCASVSHLSGGGGQALGPGEPGSTRLASLDATPGSCPCGPLLSSSPGYHLGLTRAGANDEASSQ